MKPTDKARIVEKISEPDLTENPEADLLFPTPLNEKDSAIKALITELRVDRVAQEEAITRRLHDAIAKEPALSGKPAFCYHNLVMRLCARIWEGAIWRSSWTIMLHRRAIGADFANGQAL